MGKAGLLAEQYEDLIAHDKKVTSDEREATFARQTQGPAYAFIGREVSSGEKITPSLLRREARGKIAAMQKRA